MIFSWKKPYDVVFYYPQHFNRGKNNTNPFFDPLIEACEKNGLRYKVLEEPDSNTSYKRNSKASRFDFWMYMVILLRKLGSRFIQDEARRDQTIGKIISFLSFNQFKANSYITISNSMINVLLGLNTKADVYDLQHGIIYSWHWGYFEKNGILNKNLNDERIHFLVNGNGYKNIFYKHNSNLKNSKVYVLGGVDNIISKSDVRRKDVLYTLQITPDLSKDELIAEKDKLEKFLSSVENDFIANNITLLLKHHPRFNNVIDLDEMLTRFSFVKITNLSLDDLFSKVFLHITLSSTSVFEFALAGIPSYIIPNLHGEKIFFNEYEFPKSTMNLENLITSYKSNDTNFKNYSAEVKKWAESYYEKFDEKLLIKLLKK